MISVTIESAQIRDGNVIIRTSDGIETVWPSVAAFVAGNDTSFFENRELLRRLAMALIAFRIPDITNPAAIVGRTLTFNAASNSVLVVT